MTPKPDFVRRIRPRSKIIQGNPDLLPFINVFFLLLIFFMMGSSFVPVSGIPVNLPEASFVGTYSVKKYIVTLDKNGKIYFNDAVIDNLNQLKGKLLSDVVGTPDSERGAIVLRADIASSFETVAQIMSIADELKINVFILARPAQNSARQTIFTDTEK